MAVFVSPRPSIRPAPTDSPGQIAPHNDWVDVAEPGARLFASDRYVEALGLRTQDSATVVLTQPLCSDMARLGAKRSQTITAMQLDVFEAEARRALDKISGAQMRSYYAALAKGDLASLSRAIGLSAAEVGHFYEYFFYLQEMPATQSFKRPDLLQVAARFLGGNHQPNPDMRLLQLMAVRSHTLLQAAMSRLPQPGGRAWTQDERELEALCSLVANIQECLASPAVRELLDPTPSLLNQAKNAGLMLGGLARWGAVSVADAMPRQIMALLEPQDAAVQAEAAYPGKTENNRNAPQP